jgi:hypothetical protein
VIFFGTGFVPVWSRTARSLRMVFRRVSRLVFSLSRSCCSSSSLCALAVLLALVE